MAVLFSSTSSFRGRSRIYRERSPESVCQLDETDSGFCAARSPGMTKERNDVLGNMLVMGGLRQAFLLQQSHQFRDILHHHAT